MQVATGALAPLLRKLGELLLDEYNLEKRVRKGVTSLVTELEVMHAVLRKVGDAPPEQVDGQVRIWEGKVRELSYGMEDAVDAFMVRVEGGGGGGGHDPAPGPNNIKNRVKKFLKKTAKLFSEGRALHQISDAIQEAQELGELRRRYMLEAHTSSAADAIDPRLKVVHKDVSELVDIGDTRDELIKKLLSDGDERSKQRLKTMSIVGVGGLGKTTLAKAVYEEIKARFDCGAFVLVSRTQGFSRRCYMSLTGASLQTSMKLLGMKTNSSVN